MLFAFSGAGHLQRVEGGARPRQGAGAQVRDVPEGDEEEICGGGGAAVGGWGGRFGEAVDRVAEVVQDQLAVVVDAQGEAALRRGFRSRGELSWPSLAHQGVLQIVRLKLLSTLILLMGAFFRFQETLQMLHQEGPEQPQPVTPKNE